MIIEIPSKVVASVVRRRQEVSPPPAKSADERPSPFPQTTAEVSCPPINGAPPQLI